MSSAYEAAGETVFLTRHSAAQWTCPTEKPDRCRLALLRYLTLTDYFTRSSHD